MSKNDEKQKSESSEKDKKMKNKKEGQTNFEIQDTANKMMTLAKRRGFFWSSNEIYGGIAGFFDYGPLGTRLECNITEIWREIFIIQEGFAEISTPVITPEEVFRASGHLKEFTDLMVECDKCNEPFRADTLLTDFVTNPDSLSGEEINEAILENNVKCPSCGGKLSPAFPFNLMFETSIGPGGKRIGYLRPETAQGMFVNFHLLYRYFREKLPFGIVQIGRAFRNEISPRQGMLRLREFKMGELEYFMDPSNKTHPDFPKIRDLKLTMVPVNLQQDVQGIKTISLTLNEALEKNILSNEVIAYFIGLTYQYLMAVGFRESEVRFRQHLKTEKAHYAEDCWDAEVNTSFGWVECVGIADRSCYDLEQHIKSSGHSLSVSVHYKEPIEKKVKKLLINNKNLGRRYRKSSKKIKSALEELDVNSVPDDDLPIQLTIDDEKFEIERDCFEIQTVVEKEFGKKIIPHVIEPSFGFDRICFALIENAYYERDNEFRVLRLRPGIAPIKVGVFPLMAKPELSKLARKCLEMLTCRKLITYYDESGSIGRRYARMDETGTPFCVTIDYDSLEDNTITIRERDSTEQIRIPIKDLPKIMVDLVNYELDFNDLKSA